MPITLCRVDDRLIHGQVVIGWGVPLGVDLIVLVDDTIGVNEWEQEIYRMAVPSGIAVEFVTAADAIGRRRALESDSRRISCAARWRRSSRGRPSSSGCGRWTGS